jgi:hypothetical protein
MRQFYLAVVILGLLACAAWPGLTQDRSGRYDQQISSNVARVLLSNKDCKDVSVEVEDGIVKLTGRVNLDSTRRNLTVQIRHIPHVAGIDNQLVLSPPAPPDNILYGRVISRLQEAGYGDVTASTRRSCHPQGVRAQATRLGLAKEIVILTRGVKEVEARLSIVSP